MSWESELASALRAAARARTVILSHYAAWEPVTDAPASITTEADRAAQDAIIESLQVDWPDDAVRAEESTPALTRRRREGPRMWIIDPIDGTRGFAQKNGEFSVMIALAVDGDAVLGVVDEPALQRTTYACRGGGCWARDAAAEPRRVSVSSTDSLANLTLIQSHSKPGRGPTPAVQRLTPRRVVETYSAGVKLARVARGEADVYVCDYSVMNDWDIAAGHALVVEAGGRVTTAEGQALRFGRDDPRQFGGMIASNGRIHDAVVARIAMKSQ